MVIFIISLVIVIWIQQRDDFAVIQTLGIKLARVTSIPFGKSFGCQISNIVTHRIAPTHRLHSPPSRLMLVCFQEIFVFTMRWFETILSSSCARSQRKLKLNTHEPNIYMCDLKWYTDKAELNIWKTHNVLNINTKVNFVPEHNISSWSKIHSNAPWTPICWDHNYFIIVCIWVLTWHVYNNFMHATDGPPICGFAINSFNLFESSLMLSLQYA